MAAPTIFDSTDQDIPVQGTLFKGIKFWLSQKVPLRSSFIADVRANGGEVVPLEKTADIKIVDHARKEVPPGSHSYRFIEASIRNGALEDRADHVVGPPEDSIRPIGSVIRPGKSTRNRYTQEDERILWDWIHAHVLQGGGTDGNEIYKQLELKHPQHTFQSWRDHYIKKLKGQPRPVYPPNNAPPTPPSEQPAANAPSIDPAQAAEESTGDGEEFKTYEDEDADALFAYAEELLATPDKDLPAAFRRWHLDNPRGKLHSPEQWQSFWEDSVRPRYLKRKSKSTRRTLPRSPRNGAEPQGNLAFTEKSETAKVANGPSAVDNVMGISPQRLGSPKTDLLGPLPPRTLQATHSPDKEDTGLNTISGLPMGSSFLKRKRQDKDEELPSSSPPQVMESPTPKRQAFSRAKEIASTPEGSPIKHISRRRASALFISASEDEQDEADQATPLGKQLSQSLSEPDRVAGTTQAVFDQVTQVLDLTVAPPEGAGWEDENNGGVAEKSEEESHYDSAHSNVHDTPQKPFDTQGVFDRRSCTPDLALAEPEGGWDSLDIISSPSRGAEDDAQFNDGAEALDLFIDQANIDGWSIDDILAVLRRTQELPLGAQVLEYMKENHNEVPADWKGVWTEADDEDLFSTDARKIDRLRIKHGGQDCLEKRFEFLNRL